MPEIVESAVCDARFLQRTSETPNHIALSERSPKAGAEYEALFFPAISCGFLLCILAREEREEREDCELREGETPSAPLCLQFVNHKPPVDLLERDLHPQGTRFYVNILPTQTNLSPVDSAARHGSTDQVSLAPDVLQLW